MRSTFIVTLILLVAAFAVAQDTPSPSAPAGQSQTQSQSQPGSQSGQATSPDASSSSMPAASGEVIEGCLGGSNPNYTVTDKAGATYQLVIPQGTDASVLAKHIGESVQVQGSTDKAGAEPSASASSTGSSARSSASSSGKSIRVSRIGKGNSSCPGSGAGNSSATKPPSK